MTSHEHQTSEITGNLTVCSTSYPRLQHRNHQWSALLSLCEGNPPVAVGFPSQRASNVESVSMSWCHYASFSGGPRSSGSQGLQSGVPGRQKSVGHDWVLTDEWTATGSVGCCKYHLFIIKGYRLFCQCMSKLMIWHNLKPYTKSDDIVLPRSESYLYMSCQYNKLEHMPL